MTGFDFTRFAGCSPREFLVLLVFLAILMAGALLGVPVLLTALLGSPAALS